MAERSPVIPKVRLDPWRPSGEPLWRAPKPLSWFPFLVDLVGPLYVRWGLGLDRVVLRRASVLAEAVAGTKAQGDRVLIVFRHCGDADPQGLWYALNSLAKNQWAGRGRPRFLFLASAEIALWGGAAADFALRATGALPLAHGAGSRPSLDYLRNHFKTSPDPVVIAPEGQITYELRGRLQLDPGAANMALWAADSAPGVARIVPLGVRYRAPRETWKRWEKFVVDLEHGIGLPAWSGASGQVGATPRLLRVWDQLLDAGENYYTRNHRREFPTLASRDERCRRLTEVAVALASGVRGTPVGEVRPTVFQLRAAALNVVFPRPRNPSTLGRALELRAAAEAWWMHRHQELGDLLQCLTPSSLPVNPDLERAIEAALNLADLANRLAGGHVGHRPRLFRRTLEITVGQPWVVAKADGTSHRSRAGLITNQIRQAFESLAGDGADSPL